MALKSIFEDTKSLFGYLGLNEEPFEAYYVNTLPEKAYGPKPGVPISPKLEDERK